MNKKAVGLSFVVAVAVFFGAVAHLAHAQDTTPPTVPTGITASVTQSGQVYVSWNPSTDDTGVVGYYLYRDGALIANTPGLLFYTDNAPAGNHTYTTAAYDAAGNVSQQSLPSSLVTVVSDTTPPTAPTGITLSPSSSSIVLSWNPSTDNVAVIGYYIYRNGQKLILANTIAGTTYTDTGLTPGYTYTYQVGAYDAAGNITRSASVSAMTIFDVTPPSPVSNLKAVATSSSEIDLSWNPATDNVAVSAYNIYQSNIYLTTVPSSTLSYQDTGLSPNTEYSFWITTSDEVGNLSQDSVPAAAMTFLQDLTPPSIPTGLRVASPSTSEIDLTWSPSTDNVGVVGYDVFRDGSQIASTQTTSYQDLGLTTSTTYLYAVKAYDAAGNISPQQSIGATTLATNPVTPVTTAPVTTQPYTSPVVTLSPPVTVTSPTTVTAPPTTTTTGFVFATLLSFGSRGTAVVSLQEVLIGQGDLGPQYATGYFGSLTQKAVQQFQCAQGVICYGTPATTGYGLVGVRTRRALNAL